MKNIKSMKIFLSLLFLVLNIYTYANIEIGKVTHTKVSECNGSINVFANGSASPFSISLNGTNNVIGILNNYTFENLCPGDYEIIVTNAYDCEVTLNATINACGGDGFHVGFTKLNDPTSCIENNGGILIQGGISGGTGPYHLDWSNGVSTSSYDISGLSGGTYTVTITDALGCTDEETFELEELGAPTLVIDDLFTSCQGQNNGMITIFAYDPNAIPNEQPTFSYLWSTGGTTDMIDGLAAGTYCVTVTNDETECIAVECVEVESEVPLGGLSVNASITPSCPNANHGEILLSVEGGNPPYTYDWDTPFFSTGSIILGKPQGTYCTTVTDHCGASFSECYVIGGSDPILINHLNVIGSCKQRQQGTISFNIYNGIPPFTLTITNFVGVIIAQIYNGTLEVEIKDLYPGLYTISVTDDCGQNVVIPDILVDAWPTQIIGNPETCTYDEYCLYTGENLGTFSDAGYSYQAVDYSEYNCTFYKICDVGGIPEVVNGTIVNGTTIFDGLQCVLQRTCESPDGLISKPYIGVNTNPTVVQIVVETNQNGGPSYCVDESRCGGLVIATSPKYFCGFAIIDDETEKIRGTNEETERIGVNENKTSFQIKQRQDMLLGTNEDLLKVSPNPFRNSISVFFKSQTNQEVSIRLYNVMGQNVWSSDKSFNRGENSFLINTISDLSKGLYIFELTTAKGERFTKLLIH